MKSVLGSILSIATLLVANVLHAQLTGVDLTAIEATAPLSADEMPATGTFYSAENPCLPPLPGNLFGQSAWDLGGGIYLLDDLPGAPGGGSFAMDDSEPPIPGDGEGGIITNLFDNGAIPFSTNGLWLAITNVADNTIYVNLNNATDFVYEIFSATNLATPAMAVTNWDIETEIFPVTNTTVSPLVVPMNGRNPLFLWARDWTGITHGCNTTPDWWFWEYFDTVDLSDTNLDSGGQELVNDYENGGDPNIIGFGPLFPGVVYTSLAEGTVTNISGIPFYIATLVNDTNLADADWQPYTGTNVAVSLGSSNGIYTVYVGLKGFPPNATQTWVQSQVVLEALTPAFIITAPANSTVSQPIIQLQGLFSETLSNLTYDVSNALGVITGQQGYWNPAFYDTNVLDFTTNAFQCYDIALTNGLNTITLHAVDLQGNTATTNVSFTLDYSSNTNPPALSILWPQNGTVIAGNSFALQAQVDDDTATVTAQITDTNGDTSTIQGLVERSGLVWVNNLPLSAGTNFLTVTATNAAGYSMTTNLTLVQGTVTVTMNPLTQFNQAAVTVNGTISDPGCSLTINGVSAYYLDGFGDWQATNVPVNPVGTAIFNIQVYTGDPTLLGVLNLEQPQQAAVGLISYLFHSYDNVEDYNDCEGISPASDTQVHNDNWTYQSGGSGIQADAGLEGCSPDNVFSPTNYPGGYQGYSPIYQGLFSTTDNTFSPPSFAGGPFTLENQKFDANAKLGIYGTDQAALGQKSLYLVSAQVFDNDTGLQVPASALHFMNQVPGTPVIDVTNDFVQVFSEFLAYGTAGTTNPLDISPLPDGQNLIYFVNFWTATNVTLQIIDANTGSNLTKQVNNVIVGQQMNLKCQLNVTNASLLNNSVLTNFQWTVPGFAISNYVADGQSGTVYTNFPTTNLTNVFYWVDGASSRVVQCSATVNGATITGQAIFDVLRPTGTIAAFTGTINLDAIYAKGFALHYGNAILEPGVAGVLFSNLYMMPLGDYNYGNTNYSVEWIQMVNSFSRQFQTNDPSGTWYERISAILTNSVLDDFYPYPQWTPDNSATIDAPAELLNNFTNSVWKTVKISDDYTMWLMFKPAGGGWVPLGTADWNWSGTGTLNQVASSGNYWSLTSPSNSTPIILDSTVYPQWTDNIANWQTIIPKP